MQTAVEVNMAQKYRISDKNDKEVFDFLKQNFGCNLYENNHLSRRGFCTGYGMSVSGR